MRFSIGNRDKEKSKRPGKVDGGTEICEGPKQFKWCSQPWLKHATSNEPRLDQELLAPVPSPWLWMELGQQGMALGNSFVACHIPLCKKEMLGGGSLLSPAASQEGQHAIHQTSFQHITQELPPCCLSESLCRASVLKPLCETLACSWRRCWKGLQHQLWKPPKMWDAALCYREHRGEAVRQSR